MESEKELASAEPVDIHWFDPKDYPETEPRPRKIEEDRGGGQLNITLAEGEADRFIQLQLNGKTIDAQKSVNGFVQLRFPKGWPVGDYQYKVV
jgi:hypothetical protein